MTFIYDDIEYSLPDTLADMSLTNFITYMVSYGADFREAARANDQNPDEMERQLTKSLAYLERYTAAFSFYSTIALDVVQENIDIKDILAYVAATEIWLATDEVVIPVRESYIIPGLDTEYFIYPPSDISSDSYGTFMATQDLAKMILRVNRGDWSPAPYLIAAFLRPRDAPFDPDNYLEGTPAADIAHGLNMDIALPVINTIKTMYGAFINSLDGYIPPIYPE